MSATEIGEAKPNFAPILTGPVAKEAPNLEGSESRIRACGDKYFRSYSPSKLLGLRFLGVFEGSLRSKSRRMMQPPPIDASQRAASNGNQNHANILFLR